MVIIGISCTTICLSCLHQVVTSFLFLKSAFDDRIMLLVNGNCETYKFFSLFSLHLCMTRFDQYCIFLFVSITFCFDFYNIPSVVIGVILLISTTVAVAANKKHLKREKKFEIILSLGLRITSSIYITYDYFLLRSLKIVLELGKTGMILLNYLFIVSMVSLGMVLVTSFSCFKYYNKGFKQAIEKVQGIPEDENLLEEDLYENS